MLVDALEKNEPVTQVLQRDGDRMISKMEARALLKNLSEYFDLRESVAYACSYITPNATVVHSKHFENSIAKIQEGKKQLLTPLEKIEVKVCHIGDNEEGRG